MSIQIILTLVGYFVFSAAVGAMIEPTEQQKRSFYGWLYRFLQAVAANATAVAKARFGNFAELPGAAEGSAGSASLTRSFEQRIDVATSSAAK